MESQMPSHQPSRLTQGLDWLVRILLALTFVSAGGMKLAGVPQFVALFDQIGIGQWFRLVTGTFEVLGGLLVLIPRTSIFGAVLLACVMLGAVFTHLAVIGGNPLPALVLLALSTVVLWLRRAQLALLKRSILS